MTGAGGVGVHAVDRGVMDVPEDARNRARFHHAAQKGTSSGAAAFVISGVSISYFQIMVD